LVVPFESFRSEIEAARLRKLDEHARPAGSLGPAQR
jgi:hypothetical protein